MMPGSDSVRPLAALVAAALVLGGCAALRDGAPPSPAPEAAAEPSPPADPVMYHVLVGEIAGQRDALGVAVEHYLEAARRSRSPSVAARAARIAIYARRQAEAIEAAERWVALAPDDLDARQTLAILYVRAGRTDEALGQLRRVLAAGGEGAFDTVAAVLAREKDRERALAVMDRLRHEAAERPQAHLAYARLALHAGRPEAALGATAEALRLRPGWVQALLVRARALVLLDRRDEALAELAQATRERPKDWRLGLAHARMLVEARRFDEARAAFRRLDALRPDQPDVLHALGLLAIEARDWEAARRNLERLYALGKRTDESAYFLGSIAETRKRYEEALRWFGRVQRGEYRLDARVRIARVRARMGDVDGARALLKALRLRNPALTVRLFLAEGEILSDVGRHAEALALYTRALERLPDNAELLYARALVAEKLDRLDMVEADLRRILAKDPDNVHALNALGYTLADRTDRYQEALGYIQRALELRPDNPAIIDSMGWVQYRLGNHERALEYLRRAYELSQDPEIAAHLGEVLWVMGDRPAARKVWESALREAPESEVLKRVLERFLR
ncbi:MAG TPA: tetratricopeptide repeat protein [Chromatiales bacterium]|nr:tetratricopeptide repeat protein [Chromatiales bacterium]